MAEATDIVIVGSGVAGLTAAIAAAIFSTLASSRRTTSYGAGTTAQD